MVLKNLTPAGGKVLKKSSGKGPYVLRTDTLDARLYCDPHPTLGQAH
jgi:hypothetical protein